MDRIKCCVCDWDLGPCKPGNTSTEYICDYCATAERDARADGARCAVADLAMDLAAEGD